MNLNKIKYNRLNTMKKVTKNIICNTKRCNNYVELGIPSTEKKCPDHRIKTITLKLNK